VPFAQVRDVRMFYTDEGQGEPCMLLIHGWTCDSHDWIWQLDAFASGHRVVMADNRGHGHSSVTPDGYTPRGFASDLAGLLEQLQTGPVVAVGHSLGGAIASVLAVDYPELVRAIVVVDPAYGWDQNRSQLMSNALQGLRGPAGPETAEAVLAAMESEQTPLPLRAWHRRRALGTEWSVVTDTASGIIDGPDQFVQRAQSEEYLAGRSCPVLALYADPDRAAWEATTHRHPYSRHLSWEGAGHWLHQERAADFNALVLDWVGGLPDQ
jgi:pimeloyl-ACP methyl ester carboxylesterase